MKSPTDMYDLALSSGYNLYYAVDVYFARLHYLEVNHRETLSQSQQSWFQSFRHARSSKKRLSSHARRYPFIVREVDGKWLVIHQSPPTIPQS